MRTQEGLDSTRRTLASKHGHLVTRLVSAAMFAVGTTLIFAGSATAQSAPSRDTSSVERFVGPITGLFPDSSGAFANVTSDPAVVNRNNAFFDPSLGTNGQACVTCHLPSQGFSVIVPSIRSQFDRSQGLDPLFRANDTATRPD